MILSPDYQQVRFEGGHALSDAARMHAKFEAIPWPDVRGKRVLDVGCDAGMFCWRAADEGASEVVGIDRGRRVHGEEVNISAQNSAMVVMNQRYKQCRFIKADIGKQYPEVGRFDVVFVCSLYHHLFTAAGGDHAPIWFWLRRQMNEGGELIWENPVDNSDAVVRLNMPSEYWKNYNQQAILDAASRYFEHEYVGPARHEETRVVYRFTAKPGYRAKFLAFTQDGAKGASKAFQYSNGRRMDEIRGILGFRPYVGTLNLETPVAFPWRENYYLAQMLDVVDRSKGLDSEWAQRWMRFYPLKVNGEPAYALRFDGEHYPENFLEVISERRLNVPTLLAYKNYAEHPAVEITLEK